jgi:predicted AlkP superfamily pyrophosphatase or phosphodiesterase
MISFQLIIRVTCLTLFYSGVYVEVVDSAGHEHGPDSQELRDVIVQVDQCLQDLLDNLDTDTKNFNLMVFSDHGMAARIGGRNDPSSGLINILDYINSSDWAHAFSGPVTQIWPQQGKLDYVITTSIKLEIKTVWFYRSGSKS